MSARHLITSCECFRGNRRSRSRGPNHSSASALIRLPSRGHAPSRSLSAVFRYPTAHSEPRSGVHGLTERVVLPSSFGGALGVHSLRRFTPASGGLTFLPSRAHMPFVPFFPPRFIFVGVIALARSDSRLNRDRRMDLGFKAFDFWAWLPSAVCARGCPCRGPRSCLGLCLSQVFRTRDSCIRPGSTPVPRIINLQRSPTTSASHPIRSWASAIPIGLFDASVSCHRFVLARDGSSPPTSPALQRFEGTDAWPFRTVFSARSDWLPV